MNDQEFWDQAFLKHLESDFPERAAKHADDSLELRRKRAASLRDEGHRAAAGIIKRLIASDACAAEINDGEVEVLHRAAQYLAGEEPQR